MKRCRYEITRQLEAVVSPGGNRANILVRVSEGIVEVPGYSVEARQPISFSGHLESFYPELKAAKRASGVLFAAGTTISQIRAGSEHGLEADLLLPSGKVTGVPFDCDELVPPDWRTQSIEEPVDLGRGVLRMLKEARVGLYAEYLEYEKKPPVTLEGMTDPLLEVEARGAVSHVMWEWRNGTRIDGWIASKALRVPDRCERLHAATALHQSDGLDAVEEIKGNCHEGLVNPGGPYPSSSNGGLSSRPRLVRAFVTPGTGVYSLPAQGRWGMTAATDFDTVLPAPDAEWVRLSGAHSAASTELGAWVPRSAVSWR